jgi:hypothetical protein
VSALDVDHALSVDRTLVVTWLNRGTLHMVRSEDYGWLHALTTPPLFTANARRLSQEGVSAEAAERGVAVVAESLASDGPLTRDSLRQRLDAAGIRTAGQAFVHILVHASLRGLIVRGPMIGKQHAYVLTRDWLGAGRPVDRGKALGELALRYLAGHGPADDRDLSKWSGLPLRDSRSALQSVSGRLVETDGLLDIPRRGSPAKLPGPRLLGSFEPLLLGWRSRAYVLGDRQEAVTSNGIFHPIALDAGKAVALWGLAGGRVVLKPFAGLDSSVTETLTSDGDDVVRFLGLNQSAS